METEERIESQIEQSDGKLIQNGRVTEQLGHDGSGTDDLSRYLDKSGCFPIFDRTQVTYFPLGEAVYMDILNRATDYVHIMTPYLILDGELEAALQFAALRGVDVRLILPGIPDKKIAYALAKTHYRSLHRPLGKEKLSMKIIGAAAKSLAPLM